MWTLSTLIKDIISPKYCYNCKKEAFFLCQQCLEKYSIKVPYCYICKKYSFDFEVHQKCKSKNIYYDKIIILAHYREKIIKKLIKDSKFYNKKDILEDFSTYLCDVLFKYQKDINIDCYLIVSPPMFWLRKTIRGYNQSDELAKNISKKTSILYYYDIIKKQKYTKQQSKLKKSQREKNLSNSFTFNPKFSNLVKNKNIILIDDVVSTGSTLNELSKILKQNGAKKVIGLVIASD